MPLLIAPFVGFALGTLLGFGLGLPDKARDLRFGRSVTAWFACLGFAPTIGYFAWSAPSWSFAYALNGDRLPSAISLTLVAMSAALVLLGFEAAQRAISSGEPRYGLAAGFGSTLVAVILVASFSGRLWLVGSYAEVTGGFAVPTLLTSSIGLALLGLTGLLGLALWIALSALRVEGPRTDGARMPRVVLREANQTSSKGRSVSPLRRTKGR